MPQAGHHRDLSKTSASLLRGRKPKTRPLTTEDPPDPPSPAIRCSTTARRSSIRRATSVPNVCLLSESSLAPADYTAGHNTGYKSFDPSHPCRKCWEKYSKPYSGPIIYASWNDGPSNRQRPLLNPRSSTSTPSLARSISSIVNQARNDLSSIADNPARRSLPPPSSSSAVYPPRRSHPSPFPPPLPPRPRSDFVRASVWSTSSSTSTSTCHRSAPPPTAVLRPGDPRIGGRPCWNCSGSGRTLGFLLLSDRMCDVCAGLGRLF